MWYQLDDLVVRHASHDFSDFTESSFLGLGYKYDACAGKMGKWEGFMVELGYEGTQDGLSKQGAASLLALWVEADLVAPLARRVLFSHRGGARSEHLCME